VSCHENLPLLDNLHSISQVVYQSIELGLQGITVLLLGSFFVIHPEYPLLVLTERHKGDGNCLE
jgi:hypothetical protein